MQKSRVVNSEKQLLLLFLILSGIFYVLKNLIDQTTVNYNVLIFGNLLLFIVSWISIRMSTKAVRHENVQVFLRLMYGSFILKFFVLAIAAFIYISIFKKEVNKPALFGCFGLYILYTVIEVRSVLKQSKKPNA
ncbi:MAG TPA: hypothetical protein VK772_07220 [Puia sp.]|jgi:hypothetical protein|nr:hypothetical protein [Puia sp.]